MFSLWFWCVAWALCISRAQALYDRLPTGGVTSGVLCPGYYQSIGPFHVSQTYPSITDATDPEDIGGVHDIWLSGDRALIGTLNGGVWRTDSFHSNATFGGPHWVPTSDYMPCLSISTVSGSTTSSDFLIAGCGATSNAYRSGEPLGVMISTDGARTWTMTNFPKGYTVTAALVSGFPTLSNSLLLVSARAHPYTTYSYDTLQKSNPYNVNAQRGGIWYSTDLGSSFVRVFDSAIWCLTAHPTVSTTFYAVGFGRQNGFVMITKDSGMNWANTTVPPPVSNCLIDSTSAAPMVISNGLVSVMVSSSITVMYAAFFFSQISSGGEIVDGTQCYSISYTIDGGGSWGSIGGAPVQGSPFDLGSQGVHNFAILADPSSPSTLYVAATGRSVFRVNRNTNTWTLISSPSVVVGTTLSMTAPHADARNFAWDAQTNELILVNDGGVYKRTSPRSLASIGDWLSLSGDLSIPESYDMAFDWRSGGVVLGVQDNSVMISQFDGTEAKSGVWNFHLNGDGGYVGIFDTTTNPSHYYGSNQQLTYWFRALVNAGLSSVVYFQWPFTKPSFPFLTVQAVNPINQKILVCSDSSAQPFCYSCVFPNTATKLEFAIVGYGYIQQYVYGGYYAGRAYPDLVFGVSLNFVWSRITPVSSSNDIAVFPKGSFTTNSQNFISLNTPWIYSPTALAQHPNNFFINVVISYDGHIFLTLDLGISFQDLTSPTYSNLLAVSRHTSVDTFHTGSALFPNITVNSTTPLLIGTPNGIFITFFDPFTIVKTNLYLTFRAFGVALPRSIPSTMIYSPQRDLLLVSLFGRGVFQLQPFNQTVYTAYMLRKQATTVVALDTDCTQPLYQAVWNSSNMISSTGSASPKPSSSSTSNAPSLISSSTAAYNDTSSSTASADFNFSSSSIMLNESSSSTGASSLLSSLGCTFTLNLNSNLLTDISHFTSQLMLDLTSSFNVSSSRFEIVSYAIGSIVVNMNIWESSVLGEPSIAELVEAFKLEVSQPQSSIYHGVYLKFIVAESLVFANESSSGSTSWLTLPILIAICASAAIILIVIVIFIYLHVKSRRQRAADAERTRAQNLMSLFHASSNAQAPRAALMPLPKVARRAVNQHIDIQHADQPDKLERGDVSHIKPSNKSRQDKYVEPVLQIDSASPIADHSVRPLPSNPPIHSPVIDPPSAAIISPIDPLARSPPARKKGRRSSQIQVSAAAATAAESAFAKAKPKVKTLSTPAEIAELLKQLEHEEEIKTNFKSPRKQPSPSPIVSALPDHTLPLNPKPSPAPLSSSSSTASDSPALSSHIPTLHNLSRSMLAPESVASGPVSVDTTHMFDSEPSPQASSSSSQIEQDSRPSPISTSPLSPVIIHTNTLMKRSTAHSSPASSSTSAPVVPLPDLSTHMSSESAPNDSVQAEAITTSPQIAVASFTIQTPIPSPSLSSSSLASSSPVSASPVATAPVVPVPEPIVPLEPLSLSEDKQIPSSVRVDCTESMFDNEPGGIDASTLDAVCNNPPLSSAVMSDSPVFTQPVSNIQSSHSPVLTHHSLQAHVTTPASVEHLSPYTSPTHTRRPSPLSLPHSSASIQMIALHEESKQQPLPSVSSRVPEHIQMIIDVLDDIIQLMNGSDSHHLNCLLFAQRCSVVSYILTLGKSAAAIQLYTQPDEIIQFEHLQSALKCVCQELESCVKLLAECSSMSDQSPSHAQHNPDKATLAFQQQDAQLVQLMSQLCSALPIEPNHLSAFTRLQSSQPFVSEMVAQLLHDLHTIDSSDWKYVVDSSSVALTQLAKCSTLLRLHLSNIKLANINVDDIQKYMNTINSIVKIKVASPKSSKPPIAASADVKMSASSSAESPSSQPLTSADSSSSRAASAAAPAPPAHFRMSSLSTPSSSIIISAPDTPSSNRPSAVASNHNSNVNSSHNSLTADTSALLFAIASQLQLNQFQSSQSNAAATWGSPPSLMRSVQQPYPPPSNPNSFQSPAVYSLSPHVLTPSHSMSPANAHSNNSFNFTPSSYPAASHSTQTSNTDFPSSYVASSGAAPASNPHIDTSLTTSSHYSYVTASSPHQHSLNNIPRVSISLRPSITTDHQNSMMFSNTSQTPLRVHVLDDQYSGQEGVVSTGSPSSRLSAPHSTSGNTSPHSLTRVTSTSLLPRARANSILPSTASSSHRASVAVNLYEIPSSQLSLYQCIGVGRFGSVHQARYHNSLVAAKYMDISDDVLHQATFNENITFLCSLRHVNLVAMYGMCTSVPRPIIVMEYMERGSLLSCLYDTDPVRRPPPSELLNIAIDILEAVAFMHQGQPAIVHTDLHPSNIFLSADWRAKVRYCPTHDICQLPPKERADFVSYSAPEVLSYSSSACSVCSDMYSVGVLLFELFSGSRPWSQHSAADIRTAVCTHKQTLNYKQYPMPSVISLIIAHLFAHDPSKRPKASQCLKKLKAEQAQLKYMQKA